VPNSVKSCLKHSINGLDRDIRVSTFPDGEGIRCEIRAVEEFRRVGRDTVVVVGLLPIRDNIRADCSGIRSHGEYREDERGKEFGLAGVVNPLERENATSVAQTRKEATVLVTGQFGITWEFCLFWACCSIFQAYCNTRDASKSLPMTPQQLINHTTVKEKMVNRIRRHQASLSTPQPAYSATAVRPLRQARAQLPPVPNSVLCAARHASQPIKRAQRAKHQARPRVPVATVRYPQTRHNTGDVGG
jgi:hypothetical protein